MSNSGGFLLKIHMEEKGKITEIHLNKERHSFVFVDDECVSDLVVPEFIVLEVEKILNDISSAEENGNCYVEIEKNGSTVREYDSKKVALIKKKVTKVSIKDFLNDQSNIKINDYYVDTVEKKYGTSLPQELKRLVSYTTNGVVFDSADDFYMLSHDEIIDYKNEIKLFIPLFTRNNKNYIGFDYEHLLYKEFSAQKEIKSSFVLADLLKDEELEVLDMNDNHNKDESIDIQEESSREDETLPIEEEKVSQEYEETIKNIDAQLEKLSTGIEKVETPNTSSKEEIKGDDEQYHQEVVDIVKKALNKIEETNTLIDEIDNTFNSAQKTEEKEKVKDVKTSSKKEKQEKPKKEIKEVKPKKTDNKKLTNLMIKTLDNSFDNYQIDFNETAKLVVEHLPYYEISSSFDVIQIPEIEMDKITLLPNSEIDLGKFKLKVSKLDNNMVDLVVVSASSIVNQEGSKVKKQDHIILDLHNEFSLRLNKSEAMESWSLKMEKSTFEAELRNIDYLKIISSIEKIPSYKSLGNIEKYELSKSVMLFINFVMKNEDYDKLKELYRIIEKEPTLYEEYITKYNIDCSNELNNVFPTYDSKKTYSMKLNYINGLVNAKWLDYPRYIFGTLNYFSKDYFLEEFINQLNDTLTETDFSDYLKRLFSTSNLFADLDEVGQENLDKCLDYLSVLYKYNPIIGEENKYKIEREFMIGATDEDISLLISKVCRRGIKDYSTFIEYESVMKEKYRMGNLKYPIYSEDFGIEEIRNGGEYDEY